MKTIKVFFIEEFKQDPEHKPNAYIRYRDFNNQSHTLCVNSFVSYWYSDTSKSYIISYDEKKEYK